MSAGNGDCGLEGAQVDVRAPALIRDSFADTGLVWGEDNQLDEAAGEDTRVEASRSVLETRKYVFVLATLYKKSCLECRPDLEYRILPVRAPSRKPRSAATQADGRPEEPEFIGEPEMGVAQAVVGDTIGGACGEILEAGEGPAPYLQASPEIALPSALHLSVASHSLNISEVTSVADAAPATASDVRAEEPKRGRPRRKKGQWWSKVGLKQQLRLKQRLGLGKHAAVKAKEEGGAAETAMAMNLEAEEGMEVDTAAKSEAQSEGETEVEGMYIDVESEADAEMVLDLDVGTEAEAEADAAGGTEVDALADLLAVMKIEEVKVEARGEAGVGEA